MIDTIHKILEEIDSLYYSYDFENNTIQKIRENSSCCNLRDLIDITNKLRELDIAFKVTEDESIQLL